MGAQPGEITRELEALKRRLIAMSADDISAEQTQTMAQEIGVILLQLKRLAAEQAELHRRLTDLAQEF